MKTALLLGSLGSGLILLTQLYFFITNVSSTPVSSDFTQYYVHSSISIVAWGLIFCGCIIGYQSQNKKPWKE